MSFYDYLDTDEISDTHHISYDDIVKSKENTVIPTEEEWREKPAIYDKYRDALYSLSGAVELNGFDDEYHIHQSHELYMYSGNKYIKSPYKPTDFIPSSSDDFDVSIVTQTSYERLFFFPHMLRRWDGPISATVYLDENEVDIFDEFIKDTPLPRRLQLVVYHVLPRSPTTSSCVVYYDEVIPADETPSETGSPDPSITVEKNGRNRRFRRRCEHYSVRIYPINRLRNIAIQNIRTTHFLVLDMDMWPVETTYQDLISLPSNILRNENLALILPAFSLENSVIPDCNSFQDCVEKKEMIWLFICRVLNLLPSTKEDLSDCIDKKKCSTFRPDTNTHNYMIDGWYSISKTTRFIFKQCFDHMFQEPYLMVRRSARMPLFDERFINYGYNKVEWVENLRWIGYQFALITQSYAIDIPHPASEHQKSWSKLWEVKNNPNITMRTVYRKFLTELRSTTNDDSTVFVCHRYKNRFTKNIAVNHQDMKDKAVHVKENTIKSETKVVNEEKMDTIESEKNRINTVKSSDSITQAKESVNKLHLKKRVQYSEYSDGSGVVGEIHPIGISVEKVSNQDKKGFVSVTSSKGIRKRIHFKTIKVNAVI